MEIIYAARPRTVLFHRLGVGRVFRYPDGDKLYIVLPRNGHDLMRKVMKLDDGQVYDIGLNKLVAPVVIKSITVMERVSRWD